MSEPSAPNWPDEPVSAEEEALARELAEALEGKDTSSVDVGELVRTAALLEQRENFELGDEQLRAIEQRLGLEGESGTERQQPGSGAAASSGARRSTVARVFYLSALPLAAAAAWAFTILRAPMAPSPGSLEKRSGAEESALAPGASADTTAEAQLAEARMAQASGASLAADSAPTVAAESAPAARIAAKAAPAAEAREALAPARAAGSARELGEGAPPPPPGELVRAQAERLALAGAGAQGEALASWDRGLAQYRATWLDELERGARR